MQVAVPASARLDELEPVVRVVEDDVIAAVGSEYRPLVPRRGRVFPLNSCTRSPIAVSFARGRNQIGSPVESTISGPTWLSLAGVACTVPVAAVMSNGARKMSPVRPSPGGVETVIAGGLRSGRLWYGLRERPVARRWRAMPHVRRRA